MTVKEWSRLEKNPFSLRKSKHIAYHSAIFLILEHCVTQGWIKNTAKLTVKGQLEGEKSCIEKMKIWLSTTGSPSCRISKAMFTNERVISEYSFEEQDFQIRH